MIKSLEIKNFENHEHTVLKDFSSGFNLICGRSNQGKTSILRALKAVCFNEFNPKSIRVGTKYCEITLTTDKGTVYVRKGPKDNHWETTVNGEKTKVWDKVGKNLPDAVPEITGMRLVNLGGIEFNANFMDQLSSHFMLASIDDHKASPSDRVRIVDAISGLMGVEELIRDISASNKNTAKQVGDDENAIKDLEAKKHDQDAINAEKEVLEKAKKIFDGINLKKSIIKAGTKAIEDANGLKESIFDASERLKEYDNVETAEKHFSECAKSFMIWKNGTEALRKREELKAQIASCKEKWNKIPEGLDVSYETLSKSVKSFNEMRKTLNAAISTKNDIKQKKTRLNDLPNVDEIEKKVKKIEMFLSIMQDGTELLTRRNTCQKNLETSMERLKLVKKEEEDLEKQMHELLGSTKICPFCGQRILETR